MILNNQILDTAIIFLEKCSNKLTFISIGTKSTFSGCPLPPHRLQH